MPAYIFDRILSDGVRAGQLPAREQKSREWFRDRAAQVKSPRPNRIIRSDADRLKKEIRVMDMGKMYMFFYNPKTKEDLPFYDRFPLIFPYKTTEDGFMGINLHYLPYNFRAALMDSLYELVSDKNYDQDTRLKRLTYERLNSAARFRYFKPCIKRYITSHIESRFFEIHPTEWDIALFLRTERFVKATKNRVWTESRKIIRAG